MVDRDADVGPRLFVAVALPEPAADQVRELAAAVQAETEAVARVPRSAVRWVRMDGLHLTLRFLGPTEEANISRVAAAVDRAAAESQPIEVSVGGGGAFPSAARPRTIWLGVSGGAEAIGQLSMTLNRELESEGWPPDDRPFRPHLTLARADGRREGPLVARLLIERAGGFDVRFEVDRLVLYESITGGGPARYVPRHERRLGSPKPPAA